MEFVVFSALCSVLVSILLKWLKSKAFEPLQMIAWNYLSASILCFLWFKPNFSTLSFAHSPWWLIVLLSVLLPSIFLVLAKSLQQVGIVKTELAQRLSVVLSLLAAYFLFQEQFNTLKITGIVLGVCSVICILFTQQEQNATRYKSIFILVLVWAGYAFIDILLKCISNLGLQFAVTLNITFIFAFILSFLYISFFAKQTWQTKNIIAGLFLGGLNFLNIALYVNAHIMLKDSPAIVFLMMNVLVVVFGVLSGMFLFKERIKTNTWVGLMLAIVALMTLAKAM